MVNSLSPRTKKRLQCVSVLSFKSYLQGCSGHVGRNQFDRFRVHKFDFLFGFLILNVTHQGHDVGGFVEGNQFPRALFFLIDLPMLVEVSSRPLLRNRRVILGGLASVPGSPSRSTASESAAGSAS